MVVEAEGLIILVRETIFSAAKFGCRSQVLHPKHWKLPSSYWASWRRVLVCYVYVGLYNEKINGLDEETSFGMAYFQEFLLN